MEGPVLNFVRRLLSVFLVCSAVGSAFTFLIYLIYPNDGPLWMTAFVSFFVFLGISKYLGSILKKKFLALAAGSNIGEPKYHFWDGWRGIAINIDSGTVCLWANGAGKTYPWSELRSWEKKSQEGGMHYGGGSAGLVNNIFQLGINAMNTGLVVNVADFNNPVWMIVMPKVVDRNRWFELLHQVINEGRQHAR